MRRGVSIVGMRLFSMIRRGLDNYHEMLYYMGNVVIILKESYGDGSYKAWDGRSLGGKANACLSS
jgi:hypothetical protein